MKKCASCSKDLPDAALHCVFCGSKQPPAPATTGGLAKTVMGSYSANDVMEQLRQQGAPRPAGPTPGPAFGAPRPASPTPGPAFGPPPGSLRPAPGPTPAPPPGVPPMPGPISAPGPTVVGGGPLPGVAPMAPPQPYGVPSAASAAPTLFVPGPGGPAGPAAPPAGGYGGPAAAKTIAAAPSALGGGFGPTPPAQPGAPPVQPFAGGFGPGGPAPYAPPVQPKPIPAPMPQPYLAAQASARAGRPFEPWKSSLPLMMIVWGGVLLIVFATPLQIEPLGFSWDAIMHAEGKAKLPPLLIPAIGLLGLVLALIPMAVAPRGLLAGLLGLAGIAVPLALGGAFPWRMLVPMAGMLLLIPGLLIREEYRESLLPRFMVTIAVIAVILPEVLPLGDRLPLVDLFKSALDLPGKAKVAPLLEIGYITLIVLTLLAWLPAPASGGAKVFAWIILLWPAVPLLTAMILNDQIVDAITKQPNSVIVWAAGTAYAVLVGYGFASLLGKRLE